MSQMLILKFICIGGDFCLYYWRSDRKKILCLYLFWLERDDYETFRKPSTSTQNKACIWYMYVSFECWHLSLSRNLLGVHASYKNLLIYQRNSCCKRKDSPLIFLVFERQSEPSSLICKHSYCLHLALVVYYFCSYHHHHYCAIWMVWYSYTQ